MKTYDAIVVGAGHNGLTNAAFLAKAGAMRECRSRATSSMMAAA